MAYSQGLVKLKAGDEILLSVAEHHSNLMPWQMAAKRTGAALWYLYTDAAGKLTLEEVKAKWSSRTRLVAFTHISNVLGIENPVKEIADFAHAKGAIVVLDGAQRVPHVPVDVRALNIDFMAFSGHKMYAPDGIGVLYGKKSLLDEMEPMLLGGGIVEQVAESGYRLLDTPLKFDAGTPNVEGAVGLREAIDYMEQVGFDMITRWEAALTAHLFEKLQGIPELEIYGGHEGRTGIVAFNIEGVHPHDVASILDAEGITIRAGHHCAQPLLTYLGVRSCCRASLAFYNTGGY